MEKRTLVCDVCGEATASYTVKPVSYTYKGHQFTINQPAIWCTSCGEGIITPGYIKGDFKMNDDFDKWLNDFRGHIDNKDAWSAEKLSNKNQILMDIGVLEYKKKMLEIYCILGPFQDDEGLDFYTYSFQDDTQLAWVYGLNSIKENTDLYYNDKRSDKDIILSTINKLNKEINELKLSVEEK